MKLNEKYELIEKVKSNKKKLYRAKDLFNDIEIFIEPYQEISASDWTMGGKINEELRKLKLSTAIDDYFYTDNKEKKTKIFYKVYLDNPLTIKKQEKAVITSHTRKRRKKTLTKDNFDEESTAISNDVNTEIPKPVNPSKLERIMVCENCKTEINLRNYNNSTNTVYCETCHKKHKVIFQEIANKKERAKLSKYVKISKGKNKLLIEISKDKIETIFIFAAILIWSIFRLAEVEYIFQTLEIYLYIGFALILFLMVLDKNYIEVTKGVLKIYSKPLSISAAKKFKAKDIEQLYVKKGITEGAGVKSFVRFANGRRYESEEYVEAELDVYNLIVILKDGKGEFSILETHNSADALYLEKLIEKFLKIKDVGVAKEIV